MRLSERGKRKEGAQSRKKHGGFCAWAMAKRFSNYGKEKSRDIRCVRRTSPGRRETRRGSWVNLQAKRGKRREREELQERNGTLEKRGERRNTSSKSARRV